MKIETGIIEILNGDVRIHRTEDNHTCFVPLWHDEIYFDQYDTLFLIHLVPNVMISVVYSQNECDDDLMISRENAGVRICENTFDLHIDVNTNDESKHANAREIWIGDLIFYLKDQTYKKLENDHCYHFAKRGIFLCNDDDIYDTSASSDVLIHLRR